VPGGQVLAHADRAQGVGARVDGLALAQERDVRASPAHLHEHGVPRGERLVVSENLAHRHVRQAILLRPVDHLHVDAGAQAHPVDEGVAVQGLSHRTRGHRAVADHTVAVHDPAEALEGLQGRLDGGRTQPPAGKGVLAEEDAAGDLLEDPHGLPALEVGHDKADRARAQVEHGHRAGRLGRRQGQRAVARKRTLAVGGHGVFRGSGPSLIVPGRPGRRGACGVASGRDSFRAFLL